MKNNVTYRFAVARRAVALLVFATFVCVCVWHFEAPAARHQTLSAAPRHAGSDCPNTWTPNESRSIEAYHNFDVPAGEFQVALDCFLNQSGLGVGWTDMNLAPDNVKTRSAKGYKRSMDVLVEMVSGSKLEVVPPTDARNTTLWLVLKTGARS